MAHSVRSAHLRGGEPNRALQQTPAAAAFCYDDRHRSAAGSALPRPPAAVLLFAGVATLWWSNDLMKWLIWLVGEEYALGAQNVIHLENGATLITNPSGMIRWTLPFWLL